jgi:hypothetical protein
VQGWGISARAGPASVNGADALYVDTGGFVFAVDSLHGTVVVFAEAAFKGLWIQ